MPDRPIVWADQPLDAYLALPADRQAAVVERLRALADDPYTDTAYDPTWHWWTAEYGAGTGFVTFVIASDDHLVVVRLIDAACLYDYDLSGCRLASGRGRGVQAPPSTTISR